MVEATVHISEELKLKITEAIKTRSSLEMLLQEEAFQGTRASISELLALLQQIMGNRMMLEFVFSSHIAIWEEYRKLIDRQMWLDLDDAVSFTCEQWILLATSLIYRDEIALGTEFLKNSIATAYDTKSFISVAESIHTHLHDNDWAEKVLLEAGKHCTDSEHFSQIAEAMILIAEDRDMAIAMFNEALNIAGVAHEFIEIATAVARALGNRRWAEEIFNRRTSVPESNTPIEMLAEEAYHEEIRKIA